MTLTTDREQPVAADLSDWLRTRCHGAVEDVVADQARERLVGRGRPVLAGGPPAAMRAARVRREPRRCGR